LAIIKKIEDIIKESLSEYDVSLILYGSFATELEIESSDIDITVKFQNKNDNENNRINNSFIPNYFIESTISKLAKSFINKNIFNIVNPIYTATVPVIKLV
jgi:DNA polymerase sigma